LKKTVKGALITAALALAVTSVPMIGNAAAKTTIIITNGKGEISTEWKAAAAQFSKENPDINVEAYSIEVGDQLGPYQKLTKAGKIVTVAMTGPDGILYGDFKNLGIDLSKEKWVKDTKQGFYEGKKLVGFPFAIEGHGIIYNKAVVAKAVKNFNPFSINTQAKLEALFKKVAKVKGVEAPVSYNTEAWSLGNHLFSIPVAQTGDPFGFNAKLVAGKIDASKNATYKGVLNYLDLMMKYNITDKPLTNTYDKAHQDVASGKAAFTFNGNWAWQNIEAELKKLGKTGDFGFMPVPVDNNPKNKLNNALAAGPTQTLVINKQATKAQQAAAKRFLNWIVYSKSGQNFLVTKSQIIPAFKNIKLKVNNPLGNAVADAVNSGKVFPFTNNYINGGKYFALVGPAIQKYIAGKSTRAQFFKEFAKAQADIKASQK
jgi:raffinose/stachyose/melibiose transport system substrate-binding protein